MKKFKTKQLKGMTLIEVIIALLIFTLLATIMVQMGSVTKSLMLNTNHVNNKTVAESPIGSVQDVDALREAAGNLTDNTGTPIDPDAAEAMLQETPITITVTSGSFNATINARRYSTEAAAREASQNGRNCDTSTHLNGDLEFYVIDEEEEEEPGT